MKGIVDKINELQGKFDELINTGSPWGSLLLLPLARRVAPYCHLSANKITLIGFGVGLLGCAGLGFGDYWYAIAGATLLNVTFFIDYIDGLVARMTKTVSLYGRWLDGFTGYILEMFLPVAIGIGLVEQSLWFLVLGMGYGFIKCFALLVASYYSKVFGEEVIPKATKSKLCRAGRVFLSVELPLLLVFAIVANLDKFLVVYSLAALAKLGIIVWQTLKHLATKYEIKGGTEDE